MSHWKKGSQILISFSIQRREGWHQILSLNREITKPTCHGGTVCRGLSPPAWLPHKGHQSSAETAQSRGLSVSAWVDMCVHKGGERGEKKKERGRVAYLMLTGQFQAVGPDGPVWPLIPQAIVQVSICQHTLTHTHTQIWIYTGINKAFPLSQCFRFQFLPEKLTISLTCQFTAWASSRSPPTYTVFGK